MPSHTEPEHTPQPGHHKRRWTKAHTATPFTLLTALLRRLPINRARPDTISPNSTQPAQEENANEWLVELNFCPGDDPTAPDGECQHTTPACDAIWSVPLTCDTDAHQVATQTSKQPGAVVQIYSVDRGDAYALVDTYRNGKRVTSS